MKMNLKYSLIGFALVVLAAVGCDEAQEVAPTVSPDGYPMVSYAVDNDSGAEREGNTLTYTITTDKALTQPINFSVKYLGGDATEDEFTSTNGVLEAYSTQTTLTVTFLDDDSIEAVENIKYEIGSYALGDKYLLNPNSENLVQEIAINAPANLQTIFSWNSEDDIDIVVFKDNGFLDAYSDKGATLSNPEFDNSIRLDDPGTYYINVMNGGAPNFDYTFTLGKPDNTVETITGTFLSDNLETYFNDYWFAWGGMYNSYRVLKVVNDGVSITVTPANGPSSTAMDVSSLAGEWGGTDGSYSPNYDWRFASHITTSLSGSTLQIDSINYEWMQNIWGEEFQEIVPVDINIYDDGHVEIPSQYHFTTLYEGNPYQYNVSGFGQLVGSTLYLKYELEQDGFYLAYNLNDWGYMSEPFFQAAVELGAKSLQDYVKPVVNGFTKPDRVVQTPQVRTTK